MVLILGLFLWLPFSSLGAGKQSDISAQYLVAFKAKTTPAFRSQLFGDLGIQELEKVGSTELYLIEVPLKNRSIVLEKLRRAPEVRYVEANQRFDIHQPVK